MKGRLDSKQFLFLRHRIICMICMFALLAGCTKVSTANASTGVRADADDNELFYDNDGPCPLKVSDYFFESSYLAHLSWNLEDKPRKEQKNKEWMTSTYDTSKTLTLDNKSKVKIFYTSEYKDMVNDREFDQALAEMLNSFKENPLYKKFTLTNILVSKVQKIEPSDLNKTAQEFFDKNDINEWYPLYKKMDADTQKSYYDRIISEQKIKLLKVIFNLSDEEREQYFKKAYESKKEKVLAKLMYHISDDLFYEYVQKSADENNLECFDILCDRLDDDKFDEYLKKSYKDKSIEFFRILIDHADDKTIKYYYKKAIKDNKKQYINIIEEYI